MKPTPAQSTLFHSLLSAVVAVIMAAAVTIAQFYFAHGQDLVLTSSFALGSFAVTFAAIRTAVWHAFITSPVRDQAQADTVAQLEALGKQVAQQGEYIVSQVMPFVHQHPAAPAQPAPQGRVSSAVTAPAPKPITFPPASAAHFGDTGVVPAVPQQ